MEERTMILTELVKKWSLLKDKKTELGDQIKGINFEMEGLEKEIIRLFANEEIHSMKIGKHNYYTKVNTYASSKDKEKLLEWLEKINKNFLVTQTVPAQTLSKLIRELQKKNEDIPKFISVYDEEKLVRAKAK